MPLFTSLLFFFIALAFLPLVLRSRARSELRRQAELDNRMTLGASICIAAAREAFGVELDRSLASIAALDALITQGWNDSHPELEAPKEKPNDLTFVFAAYLGDTVIKHTHARWRIENGQAVLLFREANVSASPMDLIERKLRDPQNVHIEEEIAQWGNPADDRSFTEGVNDKKDLTNAEHDDG